MKFLSTPGNIARLTANLDKLYSPTEEELNAINTKAVDFAKGAEARYRQLDNMDGELRNKGESLDDDLQKELLENHHHIHRPLYYVCPSLARDTGAEILDLIASSTKPIPAIPDLEFIGDGMFCEWAYVVDLDSNKLEAYAGWRKTAGGTRFDDLDFMKAPEVNSAENAADGPPTIPKASPGFMGSWDLSMLPSEEQFLKDMGIVRRAQENSDSEEENSESED